MSPEREQAILTELFMQKRMTFQEIVDLQDSAHTGNRNRTRDAIDSLIERGLVVEENRAEWKRGKKLFTSVTKKGEAYLIKNLLTEANNTFKTILRILESVKSDEMKTEKLSKLLHIKEKTIQDTQRATKVYGSLKNCLKTLYDIFILTRLLPRQRAKEGFAISFHPVTGDIYLSIIPLALKQRIWETNPEIYKR